jgi:hypothetical protein
MHAESLTRPKAGSQAELPAGRGIVWPPPSFGHRTSLAIAILWPLSSSSRRRHGDDQPSRPYRPRLNEPVWRGWHGHGCDCFSWPGSERCHSERAQKSRGISPWSCRSRVPTARPLDSFPLARGDSTGEEAARIRGHTLRRRPGRNDEPGTRLLPKETGGVMLEMSAIAGAQHAVVCIPRGAGLVAPASGLWRTDRPPPGRRCHRGSGEGRRVSRNGK